MLIEKQAIDLFENLNMYTFKKNEFSIVAFSILQRVLVCFLLMSCTQQEDDSDLLEGAFLKLYSGISAKDFPRSNEVLSICKEKRVQKCLDLYKRVLTARRQILIESKEDVLNKIFNTIQENCKNDLENLIAYKICHGAVMPLVFYNTSALDMAVLNKAKQLTPSELGFLLSTTHLSWIYNRINKEKWAELAQNEKIEWMTDESQEEFLEALNRDSYEMRFWVNAPKID